MDDPHFRIPGEPASDFSLFQGFDLVIGLSRVPLSAFSIKQLSNFFCSRNLPVSFIAADFDPNHSFIAVSSSDSFATPRIAAALASKMSKHKITLSMHLPGPGAESALRELEGSDSATFEIHHILQDGSLPWKCLSDIDAWEVPAREYQIQPNEIEKILGLFETGLRRPGARRQSAIGVAHCPDMIGIPPLTPSILKNVVNTLSGEEGRSVRNPGRKQCKS
jgi:hypothetical protein